MFKTARSSTPHDMFGAKREALIAKSKVRTVFTPSQPVRMMDLLLGRDNHVARIIEILNTPGQHALLFGDRGVGKSSLANVAMLVLDMQGYFKIKTVFQKTCSSSDTFETIVFGPLKSVGVDISLLEINKAHKQKGAANISAFFAKADIESARETTEKRKPLLTVSIVAESLKGTKGLLIIDEADAISSDIEKKKIAELIKLLSDAGSPFKIMVVGIAGTGAELIAGHKSVERCLGQVRLERLKFPELWKIISLGQQKIIEPRIQFDSDVMNSIVEISNGYPYFTHLLALKCAEDAIASGRSTIRKDNLLAATEIAAEAAESTLRDKYYEAIRSTSANRDLYRIILLAAAKIPRHEITSKELCMEICRLAQRELSQKFLTNYYKSLISDGNSTILRRIGRGVYCFNDPRFSSFIRIVNGDI
jgi:hypothetical protein